MADKRWCLMLQRRDGDLVGRPVLVSAPSVTMALRAVSAIPAGVDSVLVVELVPGGGVRVPVWHTSPSFSPSSEWSAVR